MTGPTAVVDGGTRVGAAALGVAALAVVAPRADPADAATATGLVLLTVAAVVVLNVPTVRRSALLAVPAAAALVAVGVGHSPTATVVERDLWIGCLPLVLALAAAVLVRDPRLSAATAVGGVLAGPVRLLFYDPFLDPGCVGCVPGRLVVWPSPDLADVLHALGLAITVSAVTWALANQRAPVELFGLLACLATYAGDVARDEAVVIGGVLAACWLGRSAVAVWRRRREVRRLLRSLDGEDDLTTILRRDLDDPGLVVGFPDGDDLVDRAGEALVTAPDLIATDLLVEGTVVARVLHAPLVRVPELAAVLDGPARLGLANERLTAQLAARVHELTRARTAVVETGVRDRRSLERDLHDGVQQDLLALGLDLRVAADRLVEGDPRRRVLENAVVEVHSALDEVRDVSHGVYPPLLATRGLGAAAASLVRRTSTAVEIGPMPDRRFADAVERAAFAVVAEAIDRGAHYVEATLEDGRVLVRAAGTGSGIDGILPDMVAAVGGEVDLAAGEIKAAIPCA